MRGISVKTFGGPEVLTMDNNLKVPSYNDDQLLIKLAAAGINPVEALIRTGTFPNPPALPYTPGFDGAGVVEKIGKNVKNFKVGDRVITAAAQGSGTYAEYVVTTPLFIAHLGSQLTFDEGAGIGIPYYTAYKLLCIIIRARAGETLLVHGASGAVGLASVQLAKSIGLKVIGTAGTPEGMKLAKGNGADFVFNHRDKDYMKHITDAAPEGIDIILEMLANVNLDKDLDLIKNRGRIGIVGSKDQAKIDTVKIMFKECLVTGVLIFLSTEAEWKEMHGALEAGIKSGWLKPHIGLKFSLGQAAKAHDTIMNNSGTTGRIILQI
ncbi:quinone oxidoreductase [Patella vulgata]|uniref:quinone oxidoreductase n=1 Tax=Patella vulgata TaxID=6465 RepID=UPI00218047B5|nr:quinone oxidoreductase [Patella vulgata]XP_050410889.1 quinone oxidoreductase [Patella vulgata]XP_050410891.1 quinone oxidoreductase [Patella vulgata]